MSDDNTIDLVESEDFESWYDSSEEVVGITFLADGVTKLINKEDFREFRDFNDCSDLNDFSCDT